jgi:hypothetical protein
VSNFWGSLQTVNQTSSLVTTGLFAAWHVYIEFNLGGLSKVYDSVYPMGDGTISDYQRPGHLQGVHWRDCRKFIGLTPDNLGRALASVIVLQREAQGIGRIPSNNRLGRDCPLG